MITEIFQRLFIHRVLQSNRTNIQREGETFYSFSPIILAIVNRDTREKGREILKELAHKNVEAIKSKILGINWRSRE